MYVDNDIVTFLKVKGRLIGIDFGHKRIGVAISDETQTIATPYRVLDVKDKDYIGCQIDSIIAEFSAVGIVFGWPLLLSGLEGESCKNVSEFVEFISGRSLLPFLLWDERLSSSASESVLIEANMSRKKRKVVIDKLSAAYILQGALDFLEGARSA